MRPAILVVDDDPLVREFLHDLLEMEDYAVRYATDAAPEQSAELAGVAADSCCPW